MAGLRVQNYANVDCSKDREMGCQTFCCRLLVRLDDDERMADGLNFVGKGADGFCKHLNRENHLCAIWERRSRVCRGYDCNSDFLLQRPCATRSARSPNWSNWRHGLHSQ